MIGKDVLRLFGLTLLAAFIGAVSGAGGWLLAGVLFGYALWQQRAVVRLLRWIRNRKSYDAPEGSATLDEVCREVNFLRERHKKRKKKLSQYLKQFQEATMALPDAVVVMNDLFEVQWANAASQRYLGIRWPDDVNQRLTNLVRGPELLEFLRRQRPDVSIEIPSPSEPEVYLSVRIAPYGKGQWLFVARDVTELHLINQVRSDFVANVSHELRTPLTVFKGYIETLSGQRELAPNHWGAALDQMSAHADRMHSIIEELLLLSRLERSPTIANPKPVEVANLVTDMLAEARALGRDKQQLFSIETDSELLINGESSELYSAFSNLVFNAVNYTQARGVIRIHWFADAKGAHFEVTDNGPGIPEEHIPRLTERFYRVDQSRSREFGGTGLGLAIVKHVLQRHQATLEVRSKPNEGSTFLCHFPLSAIERQTAEQEDEEKSSIG